MDDNPVVCITQLSCIHKLTPITEYIYPPNLKPENNYFPLDLPGIDFTNGIANTEDEYRECIALLPHFAFGDMNPSMTADVIYMILPASTGRILYGISYYRRFNSFHVRGNDKVPINLWKSVCLLFRIPFFGAVSARLKPIVLSHYINIASRDMKILEDAFHHINNSLAGNTFQYEDLFFDLNSNDKSIVMAFELELLTILVKAILLERRIVVYSKSAFSVTSSILSLLGLIPAALTLGLPTQHFGKDSLHWQQSGLPLKIFHQDNPLMLICPKNMIGIVSTKKSYLVGITDLISFRKLEKPVDVLIDLDNTLITICNRNIYWITYTTLHDECFFISSIFDDTLFKDVISAAKESSRVAINLVGSALSKLPGGLIALARFSNKTDSKRRSDNDDRESIAEFIDKLFPGATPKWLRKAIDAPSKSVRKVKNKGSSWLPFMKKFGLFSVKDKVDKNKVKEKPKLPKQQFVDSANSSTSYEDELKVISEFESRVRLINEYVLVLLQKAAYISTNERDINYITSIPDYEVEESFNGVGYVVITMRTLDTDVQNKLSIQFDKKVKILKDFVDKTKGKINDESDESVEEFNRDADKVENIDKIKDDKDNPNICNLNEEYKVGSIRGKFDPNTVETDDEMAPRSKKIKYKYVERYVPQILADQICEIQNEYSYPFLDYWIDTTNAKQFISVHNLPEISLPHVKSHVTYGKIKTYTYSNGDEYKGTTKRMLRHGKGKYVSKKGTIYEGEWRKDMRDGYGLLKSMNPFFYYSGNWKRDMKSGFGHMKTEFMEYWGQFENNQFNGSGIIVYSNGTTYEGGFKDGFYHGQGKLLENKLIKLGEFDMGKLVGTSSIIYPTGCIYFGNIEHDIPNGVGYICYDNDHNFHGYWVNGIRFGRGVLSVQFKENDDSNNELAITDELLYISDTTTYKLKQATNNLKHSQQIFSSGWTIEGTWKNDLLDLSHQLTISYPNGDKYIGFMTLVDVKDLLKFIDISTDFDKVLLPQGNGLFKSNSTGEVFDGEWNMGFFHGQGNLLLKEGITFDGQFNMNLFTTSGNLTLNNGESITLNLKFPITREQLIEIGNTKTSIELSNKHLHSENSSFLDTCITYNPYNLDFMMNSKDPSELFGDIKRCPTGILPSNDAPAIDN